MSAWLLPDSVADVLPLEARRMEDLRRRLLDRFRVHGYELVAPPLLEYTESLLAQADSALDLQTFKLLDQASGRMLGLRADTTGQVARIDAHILNRPGVTRLCYCGPVLHTHSRGLHTTREPLQCGAELYGHASLEADLEIIDLACEVLALSELTGYRLAFSHAGLVKALLGETEVPLMQLRAIHHALASKDQPALAKLMHDLPADLAMAVLAVGRLYGAGADVLKRAKTVLPQTDAVVQVLSELESVVQALTDKHDNTSTHLVIDLADLASFDYHSGLIFSAYWAHCPNPILRGGRYDNIGAVYGRPRPATGFSVDVRELNELVQGHASEPPVSAIRAPWGRDAGLRKAIEVLRAAGEVVVQALPNADTQEDEFLCDRELVADEHGVWQVVSARGTGEN